MTLVYLLDSTLSVKLLMPKSPGNTIFEVSIMIYVLYADTLMNDFEFVILALIGQIILGFDCSTFVLTLKVF